MNGHVMNQDAAETNLYAPPQALIADPADTAGNAPFYVVSAGKFLILFFATVGMYAFYWFWRHWQQHKNDRKLEIWPVPRAFFQIFFAHSLNREIDALLQRGQRRFAWSPNALATVFVVFSIIGNIADRLVWREIGYPYTDITSLVVLLPTAYCLLRTQRAANAACGDANADANRRLTIANYAWIAFGLLWWALILIGLTLSPEEAAAL